MGPYLEDGSGGQMSGAGTAWGLQNMSKIKIKNAGNNSRKLILFNILDIE